MESQEWNPRNTHHPGHEDLVFQLSSLLSTYPPPFIYINDPIAARITSSVIRSTLSRLSAPSGTPGASTSLGGPPLHYAIANAVACFSARLFYDSVINSLAGWEATWDDGCANWGAGQRWNENVDGFVHGLRAVQAHWSNADSTSRKGKSKEGEEARLVIVVEKAERLKETLPDLMVPLARLAELSRLDITTIFLSEVPWEDIRPSLGASPDPYFIDVSPPTKEGVAQRLVSSFLATSQSSQRPALHPYHPALQPLYSHFVSVVCDVCFPFTHDPHELEYIAAARWPGFVKPVLDEHARKMSIMREQYEVDPGDDFDVEISPPSEDVRMRLSRLFNPSLNTALEALYPRITNASDWAAANEPEAGLLSKHPSLVQPSKGTMPQQDDAGMKALPRMSKFILVAAFLASTNPAKSDMRMFGRGLDEKKRKRRRQAVKSQAKSKSGPAKIPQRLLGPAAFPLDRVIAILGALLEENDVENRRPAPEYTVPGERTDMEIGRVGVYSSIMELTSMRLLHRTSAADRLDGPPMFKCGVCYDVTLALARQLDIPLNDLMWDAV